MFTRSHWHYLPVDRVRDQGAPVDHHEFDTDPRGAPMRPAAALLAMVLVPAAFVTSSCSASKQEAALKVAVQEYSDKFLTGDLSAYDALSSRCRTLVSQEQFSTIARLAGTVYGSALPVRTFDATV